MNITVKELAERIDGEIVGDESIVLVGVNSLLDAKKGELSFLANPKYTPQVKITNASAVIVPLNYNEESNSTLIKVHKPDMAFTIATNLLAPPEITYKPGIHPSVILGKDVKIGENVHIGPNCTVDDGTVIGNNVVIIGNVFVGQMVKIGDNCKIYPCVSIMERVEIGNNVTLFNGCVIGSDGFGYYPDEHGRWIKIRQAGIVVIEDNVEIGANTTVDRARFGKTIIREGCKIDNLVQIAHNVDLGKNTAIAGLSGIAGSSSTGQNVRIGGHVGVSGHVHIGDYSVIGGKSGVWSSVPAKQYWIGMPAEDHLQYKKNQAHLRRISKLKMKVNELEKKLVELEKRL